MELRAGGAKGEAVFEDEIEPLLQECGAAIPVERMLKHDDVVRDELRLLARDFEVKIRIRLVEVVKGHAWDVAGGGGEVAVDARFLERGVGEEDEDAGGHAQSVTRTGT